MSASGLVVWIMYWFLFLHKLCVLCHTLWMLKMSIILGEVLEMVTEMANKDSQVKHCTEDGFTVPAVRKSLLLAWRVFFNHPFAHSSSGPKSKTGKIVVLKEWGSGHLGANIIQLFLWYFHIRICSCKFAFYFPCCVHSDSFLCSAVSPQHNVFWDKYSAFFFFFVSDYYNTMNAAPK